VRLAPTKLVTSAPGRTRATTARTAWATLATASWVSAVGVSWASSSCTSASQPWPANVGAATGWTLGLQASDLGEATRGALATGLAMTGGASFREAPWSLGALRAGLALPLGSRARETLGLSACTARNSKAPARRQMRWEADSGMKDRTIAPAIMETLLASTPPGLIRPRSIAPAAVRRSFMLGMAN